ncbi:fibronectin type III domain-containing protein, partial [Streptomyces pathocidini]
MKSRILRSALTSLTLATAAILPTAGTSQAYVSGPMGMAWFNWSIEDSSSYSLGHISFPIQVDAMDTLESGKGQYYYSNMYKINGGNRGYIGVQPIKNASNGNMQAQTIFSLFGAGAKPESDKCRSGADGGAGVSCSGWISRFEFGKTYKFEIDQDANNRSLWHGSVRFPDGHAEPIGSYSVPSNWGGIEQRETGSFVEWVRGVESCEKLPWTEVSFGRPESRNATGTTHGARSGGKCGGKTYVGISGGGTQQLNIRMGGTAQKPSAPSGLRDSGVTANQVKLMWNPAPAEENVTGYEVFRNDQKIADVSSGVEFTDTQVSPNTDYAYKVRAVNMPGESPFSNTVNVKTPAESSPSQPVVVSQAWLVKKDNGQTLVSVKGKGTPGSQVFVKAS